LASFKTDSAAILVLSFFVLFSILALHIPKGARAAEVQVKVAQDLKGNISSFSYNVSNDLLRFNVEYYNSGSLPYAARMRIDILSGQSGQEVLFTGWSGDMKLMPGDKQAAVIYGYTSANGRLVARVRAYFANEVIERSFEVSKPAGGGKDSAIDKGAVLSDMHAYDDRIVFDATAKSSDLDGVVIMATDFPPGWSFEQKTVSSIRRGSTVTISMPYAPSLFVERNVSILAISDGGTGGSLTTFAIKKESGLPALFHILADAIKLRFRGV
jgi:hypothetical protein